VSVQALDFTRILALLSLLGSSLLIWVGLQFGDLPRKVTILETKEVLGSQRLEKMDVKLDRILERLPRR